MIQVINSQNFVPLFVVSFVIAFYNLAIKLELVTFIHIAVLLSSQQTSMWMWAKESQIKNGHKEKRMFKQYAYKEKISKQKYLNNH